MSFWFLHVFCRIPESRRSSSENKKLNIGIKKGQTGIKTDDYSPLIETVSSNIGFLLKVLISFFNLN